MTLIKSISGIRGTIGGAIGDNLTPLDAVKFASAYGTWLLDRNVKDTTEKRLKVVLGRDARISGKMISSLVSNTLVGLGIDVVDLGLSTTPTVEIAVPMESANGGIIMLLYYSIYMLCYWYIFYLRTIKLYKSRRSFKLSSCVTSRIIFNWFKVCKSLWISTLSYRSSSC